MQTLAGSTFWSPTTTCRGFSGIDLLRQAKAIRPDLPVALASGYVTPELELSAIAEGASALIYKPNDVHEFCDTVQRLILDHDGA